MKVKNDEAFSPAIKAGQKTGVGVFYKDLVPDVNLREHEMWPGNPQHFVFYLDLDSDGLDDFEFREFNTNLGNNYQKYIIIKPLQNHSVLVDPSYKSFADSLINGVGLDFPDHFQQWVKRLDQDEMISDGAEWSASSATFYYPVVSNRHMWRHMFGPWFESEAGFVGVRLHTDKGYIYGWIGALLDAHNLSIEITPLEILDFGYKTPY